MIPLPDHLIRGLGKDAHNSATQMYPDNANDVYDPSAAQRDAFLQGIAWERLRAATALQTAYRETKAHLEIQAQGGREACGRPAPGMCAKCGEPQ